MPSKDKLSPDTVVGEVMNGNFNLRYDAKSRVFKLNFSDLSPESQSLIRDGKVLRELDKWVNEMENAIATNLPMDEAQRAVFQETRRQIAELRKEQS